MAGNFRRLICIGLVVSCAVLLMAFLWTNLAEMDFSSQYVVLNQISDEMWDSLQRAGIKGSSQSPNTVCNNSLLGTKGCMVTFDIVVVGAGLSGAVMADMYARFLNKTVLVLDQRNHIGGNCFDYIDSESGIRVNMYGAHVLHTDMEHVWRYVHRFGAWAHHDYRIMAKVDEKYVPIPINPASTSLLVNHSIDTPDAFRRWLTASESAQTHTNTSRKQAAGAGSIPLIHNKILRPYSEKKWGPYIQELAPDILYADVPLTDKWDGRFYPSKRFQGLPLKGYARWFERVFDHPNIHVVLGKDYFHVKDHIRRATGSKVFYSGRIDDFFQRMGSTLPRLQYRSVRFRKEVMELMASIFQPAPIVVHPQPNDGVLLHVAVCFSEYACLCM
jgi:UDP-galactopyranose mutase